MTKSPLTLQLLGSAANGGAEVYYTDLVRALAEGGGRVEALLRPHRGREAQLAAAHVPHKTFRFGGPLDLFTRGQIADHAKAVEARVLVAWMNRAASHTPKGPWARIGRLGGYYNLKYYRGFDALVGNTRDICDYILKEGFDPDRVHYIPNFAEAKSHAVARPRVMHDTPPDVPLLLSMGRLHAVKAHDVAIRAMARLPEAYLWIAGEGAEREALEALVRDLNLQERVKFLGWQSDASALYRAADLCVFPSRFEPLGNTVIQAWAHDLPVIATRAAGPSALIQDGINGCLIGLEDDEALAERVNELLKAPEQARALAEAGRKTLMQDYAKPVIVQQWLELFQRV